MDEEINYKTLRKIQEIEKNSPVLSDLKPDFYKSFIGYLKILNKRLDLEKSSQKQILIRDEIENIKKIVINIYENREKKILLAAISKARGGNPDLKNIIQEEGEIVVVKRIILTKDDLKKTLPSLVNKKKKTMILN